MMRRTIRNSAGLLGAAAIALGVFTAPASSAAVEDNCAVFVSEEPREQCFSTFTEAVRIATGGSVTDAPASAAEAVRDEALMRRMGFNGSKTSIPPVLVLFPLSIEYDAANYGAGAKLFYAAGPCTVSIADVDKQITDMPVFWDDRVSSFKNANGCWTNHYQLALFRGKATGFLNDRPVMPVVTGTNMDNRTRSIRWS
jgi:hypothetical protein